MASTFDSFNQSALGAFSESTLKARGGGILEQFFVADENDLYQLRSSDLAWVAKSPSIINGSFLTRVSGGNLAIVTSGNQVAFSGDAGLTWGSLSALTGMVNDPPYGVNFFDRFNAAMIVDSSGNILAPYTVFVGNPIGKIYKSSDAQAWAVVKTFNVGGFWNLINLAFKYPSGRMIYFVNEMNVGPLWRHLIIYRTDNGTSFSSANPWTISLQDRTTLQATGYNPADGRLYVIVETDYSIPTNEVWYSTDGVAWTKLGDVVSALGSAGVPGYIGQGIFKNGIWYSQRTISAGATRLGYSDDYGLNWSEVSPRTLQPRPAIRDGRARLVDSNIFGISFNSTPSSHTQPYKTITDHTTEAWAADITPSDTDAWLYTEED